MCVCETKSQCGGSADAGSSRGVFAFCVLFACCDAFAFCSALACPFCGVSCDEKSFDEKSFDAVADVGEDAMGAALGAE